MMEKYITDERTGLKYELVGDYYLIAGEDEPEEDRPIGVWGQRHLRYLKEHRRVRYANLLTSGELNAHLADDGGLRRHQQDRQAVSLLYVQKCPQEKVCQEDRQQVLHRGPCGQRVFENADRGENPLHCQESG